MVSDGIERFDGARHAGHGGAENVEAVDFLDGYGDDRPGDGCGLDLRLEREAARLGQGLGIVDAFGQAGGVEDDGGDAQWAGTRSAAGFVDAANTVADTEFQSLFDGKIRHDQALA